MREWALDRWSENTQVDLPKELSRLKAEIKIERESEEQAQQERDQKELVEDCTFLAELQVRWRIFRIKMSSDFRRSFLLWSTLLSHLYDSASQLRRTPASQCISRSLHFSCTRQNLSIRLYHTHIPQHIWHHHHHHHRHLSITTTISSVLVPPLNLLFFIPKRASHVVQLFILVFLACCPLAYFCFCSSLP